MLFLPCSAHGEESGEHHLPYPESHSVPGDTPGVSRDDGSGGFSFNPYTNDVFGHTDKINTHSLSTSFSGKSQRFTYRTSWHWRLITPIYKPTRTSRYLPEPVGRYADWMEVRQSFLFPTQSAAYLQLEVSFSHIGPKGGKELQNTAHAIRGLGQYGWENPARLSRLDGGAEVGWDGTAPGSVPLRIGMGYANNFLIEETYVLVSSKTDLLRASQSTERPPPFALYGSFRLAHLTGSSYAPVRPFRTAGVLKFVLWRIWQPSLSVSSAFVEGDTAPQLHVSPFDFFLAF